MQVVKNIIKKKLGIDSHSNLTPLHNLQHIGSQYHGYTLPLGVLNENSICYCVGAGDDISFDTELVVNFHSKVFIFDPSPEGLNHYNKVSDYVKRGETLSIGKDGKGFTYRINEKDFSTITYVPTGVWDQKTVLKFYNPGIHDYVSRSVKLFQDSDDYVEAPVDRLSHLMKQLNHKSIDLLKLEIEGAEYTVIDTIAEDRPDIKMILVEFDEVFHAKGMKYLFRIKNSTDKLLKAGYKIVHTTPQFKRLFVRHDLYEQLKSHE